MSLLSDILIVDATDRFGWLAGRILADLGGDVVKLDPPETQRGLADWRAFNINKHIADFDPDLPADRLRLDELLAKTDICLLTPETLISAACWSGTRCASVTRDWLLWRSRRTALSGRAAAGVGPISKSWRRAAPWRLRANPTGCRYA